jgi:hypothetical protein
MEAANTKGKRNKKNNVAPVASDAPKPAGAPELRMGKKLFLSVEERLTLQNIGLRRQILDAQSAELAKETDTLVDVVNARVNDDIGDYSINLQTGEATFSPQQATMNARRGTARPPKPPTEKE